MSRDKEHKKSSENWITSLITKLVILTVLSAAILGAMYTYLQRQGVDPFDKAASMVDGLAEKFGTDDSKSKELRSFADFIRSSKGDFKNNKAELEARLKELKKHSESAYLEVKAKLDSLNNEDSKE